MGVGRHRDGRARDAREPRLEGRAERGGARLRRGLPPREVARGARELADVDLRRSVA